MFMEFGMGISELQANVEAGKRYYVVSRFRAYQSYQLRPVRKTGLSEFSSDTPQFKQWLQETNVEAMTPSGQSLYSKPAVINGWKAIALDKWKRLSSDEKEQLTLNAEDDI